MRAAIYNPYFDTLGGGERYTLAFATALQKIGYEVFIEWKNPSIKDELEKRFGIDLSGVAFIKNVKKGDGYDLIFWVSDGSIPLLHSRKNYIHFQIPFSGVDGRSLMNRMKLFRINKIICNSEFTQKVIDKEFATKSVVIYPPVDTQSFKSKTKQNIILSVGRFSQLTQAKNQHILLEVFKKMVNAGLRKWRLVLAGGTEIGSEVYVKKLRILSKGFPVDIIESPDFNKLKDLYGISKIFWSASGFGFDEKKDPKKMEHFGIVLVESMAAGNVPVVFHAGGHKEIIDDTKNGFMWDSKSQLAKITFELINNPKTLKRVSNDAKLKAQKYSYEEFTKSVQEIIK